MDHDIKEIKADVKELLQRSAVHNQILQEHKAYSIALQAEQRVIHTELVPIKDHVKLMTLCLKLGGTLLMGVLIQAAIRYALK